MRVLWISPYFEPAYIYGGPARSIPSMTRALVKQGIDVHVYTTNANGATNLDVPLEKPQVNQGVHVTYFNRVIKATYFWSPRLAKTIKERSTEFDLIHINIVFSYLSKVPSDIASANNIPYVITPNGMLMPRALKHKRYKKMLYMRLFERALLNRANALICTDENEINGIDPLGLICQTYLVPNGIETCQFSDLPRRGMLRKRLNITPEGTVILMLGRLHPIKRPDLAVQAFCEIAAKYPQAHLILAGPDENSMEPNLRRIAQNANATERVHFTGMLGTDEVRQAYADADIFLSTSESENFGMAVVEAMAAGLPVLISEKIGISRYIASAEAGLVVALDTKEITEGLANLLERTDKLESMGKRARTIAVENFDLAVVARKMVDCYHEIISNHNIKST